MALPRTIRNFNAFVDGVSYFGIVDEGKLPAVKIQTEAHRGAGMDGPIGIDVGMEALASEMSFSEWVPAIVKKLGRQERFVFRPAMANPSDFGAVPIVATLSGLITVSEPGDLKPGTPSKLKISMDVRSYRLEIDGELLLDIDLPNAKRVIGGQDQLADMRRAMGI
ncbi:phage major tail tube protein [Cereibacter sphaeroides]|uniref:phage major tail tube protein n=1 Tax=Cereibacter sphaeroides TaxID=1063 RepID=UPI000F52991C|nr:phage major tail tube protein [Cereibacter sphaeroides]AZB57265.1 phage major tail tube protein [Cereibacter sphaeroides]AZB61549.1 phage major tail tube protein [Cereibacter sphaeroides]